MWFYGPQLEKAWDRAWGMAEKKTTTTKTQTVKYFGRSGRLLLSSGAAVLAPHIHDLTLIFTSPSR